MNLQLLSNRCVMLDYLRGILALSIMLYHMYVWNIGHVDASYILGKLGIYAVSIFFVLSGLSMGIVYNNKAFNFKNCLNFYCVRLLRILPLFFILTSIFYFGNLFLGKQLPLKMYIYNITLMFSFVKYDYYLISGAWSIGNEIFYYSCTPFIIYAYQKNKLYGNCIFIFTFLIYLIFSFLIMDNNIDYQLQWNKYINPFNNIFFYMAGLFLYFNTHKMNINKLLLYTILIIGILGFWFFPAYGNQITLVTGFNRIILSFICILIVFSCYKIKINTQSFLGKLFELFGMATYGIYLIHPIIYTIINSAFKGVEASSMKTFFVITFTISLTIVLSILSYYKFEKPIVQYGKKWLY